MRCTQTLNALPDDAVYAFMNSPVAELTIIASSQGLHHILWDVDHFPTLQQSSRQKIIVKTKKQLTEYFNGKRKIFDVPLALKGTPFQLQAWQQLLNIPYGETISYGEQAKRVGDKNKARAVGAANGRNPISIIVPCHRVIGSNGQLTGFAGGVDKKALLLELEQKF